MRDWFATLRKPRATGATRATAGLSACNTSLSLSPDDVAQMGNRWATGATSSPADKAGISPVAQVAHGLPAAPGGGATAEAKENCGFRGPVAQVAQVAQENGAGLHEAHSDEWDESDWLAFFDERAGIGEYDGGLRRADAEARAYEFCIITWMNRHPSPPSGPERCAHCSVAFGQHDGLPFLTEGGHVWLHDACHGPWYAAARAEAARALMEMGIHVGQC